MSHAAIPGKSLRTEGTAWAKVLRQEHDCVYRNSKVVRAVEQSRCRDKCADQRNSRAGSQGACSTQEDLEGRPRCGVSSRPTGEKTAGTMTGARRLAGVVQWSKSKGEVMVVGQGGHLEGRERWPASRDSLELCCPIWQPPASDGCLS